MNTHIVASCKIINRLALCAVCLIMFPSFTYVKSKDVEYNPKIYDSVYSDLHFFKDAYSYRIKNNIEVPDYYYGILKIDNPKKPIVAQLEETEHEKNKKLVPDWALRGILKHESRSYYNEDGNIVYIDKRRGRDGERGPFQMRKICFDEISKPGEQFWKVEKNMVYAEEMAIRYLLYLYNKRANQSWVTAIGMYNTGPTNYRKYRQSARNYYNEVKRKGQE